MTSYTPDPPEILAFAKAQAFAQAQEPLTEPEAAACVDCAVEGRPGTLTAVYTVSGTVLCVEHAVLARTGQDAK